MLPRQQADSLALTFVLRVAEVVSGNLILAISLMILGLVWYGVSRFIIWLKAD